MSTQNTSCAECVWCSLDVRLEEGSRFVCEKTGRPLPYNVTGRPACASYEPSGPSAFWGP